MTQKIIRRQIGKSKQCRCKYGLPIDFDELVVEITYEDKVIRYAINAEHLNHEKDSTYFYPKIVDGQLQIKWCSKVASFMRQV